MKGRDGETKISKMQKCIGKNNDTYIQNEFRDRHTQTHTDSENYSTTNETAAIKYEKILVLLGTHKLVAILMMVQNCNEWKIHEFHSYLTSDPNELNAFGCRFF